MPTVRNENCYIKFKSLPYNYCTKGFENMFKDLGVIEVAFKIKHTLMRNQVRPSCSVVKWNRHGTDRSLLDFHENRHIPEGDNLINSDRSPIALICFNSLLKRPINIICTHPSSIRKEGGPE